MTTIPRKPAREDRDPAALRSDRRAIGAARSVDLESARRWLGDNADAIKAENDYIEKHGLPLSRHRLF